MGKNCKHHISLVGMQRGTSALETSLSFRNVKHDPLLSLPFPFYVFLQKHMSTQSPISICMYVYSTLFIMPLNWKQPKRLLRNEQIVPYPHRGMLLSNEKG